MQISIADMLRKRRDAAIADWTVWRDAQYASDENKHLVDTVYKEIILAYDKSIGILDAGDPDTLPF